MRHLDWYFDFISPFSYLQHELLHKLPQDVAVNYKPILFAGLLKYWDNKGPAEIPPKRTWTFEHCAWLAHKHGIPMTMPPHHPFNPLPMLRLCVAFGATPEIVQYLFRFVWRDGHIPTQTEHWNALLEQLHVTPEMLEAPDVKEQLRRNSDDAVAARVFGVPTSVVDGHAFWGLDATDMLIAYLQGDRFFDSALFQSAHALPEGVQRPQAKAKP
jgi:2-hydroxychromene-2-carboxylate isomerase